MDVSSLHIGFENLLSRLILFESLLIALGIVVATMRSRMRPDGDSQAVVFARGALVILFGAWVWGMVAAPGRVLLSPGLFNPGSLPARLLLLDVPSWLRRFVEPNLWIAFLLIWRSGYAQSSRLLPSAPFALLASVVLEALYLHPSLHEYLGRGIGFLVLRWFHVLAVQLFLLAMARALVARAFSVSARGFALVPSGLLILVFLSTALFWPQPEHSNASLRGGAHHYLWFPENWKGGFAGELLDPPVEPLLGRYRSADRQVFLRHLEWAELAGLEFFVFDWWPTRRELRKRLFRLVRAFPESSSLKFAIHYEALDLREIGDPRYPGEGENAIYLSPERVERLKKHIERIARYYMRHPAYLTVDDKPVLFVYASRHLVGPVREAFDAVRRHVRAVTDLRLFIVGDEAFFNVLDYDDDRGVFMRGRFSPAWDRLSAFDALTAYNPYDPAETAFAGEEGAEKFLDAVGGLYEVYRSYARQLGQVFVPSVIPGYNDRGVRPKENHYVVPRAYSAAGERRIFLRQALDRWVKPFADGRHPLFTVTSWNEWNEWTQVEPSRGSGGLGDFDHLEILRQFLSRESGESTVDDLDGRKPLR